MAALQQGDQAMMDIVVETVYACVLWMVDRLTAIMEAI